MAQAQQEQCAEDRLARWRKKWDAKATNFHLDEEHPVLTRHAPPLASGARVLLPLCGKSLDLAALADRGFDVVGVDGCAGALDAFASEHGGNVEPGPNHLSVVRLPSTRTVGFKHPPFDGGKLGPPFAVPEDAVHELFDGAFDVALLEREDRMDAEPAWRERGCDAFFETSSLLRRRQ
ncbi:thiopurine S-methyltransferase [Aureococcus anophagefferens]|nr:thiopurine S-methyltransferase [Aureococcus anophagefferens]